MYIVCTLFFPVTRTLCMLCEVQGKANKKNSLGILVLQSSMINYLSVFKVYIDISEISIMMHRKSVFKYSNV